MDIDIDWCRDRYSYLYIGAESYWRRSEAARNLGSAGAVSNEYR